MTTTAFLILLVLATTCCAFPLHPLAYFSHVAPGQYAAPSYYYVPPDVTRRAANLYQQYSPQQYTGQQYSGQQYSSEPQYFLIRSAIPHVIYPAQYQQQLSESNPAQYHRNSQQQPQLLQLPASPGYFSGYRPAVHYNNMAAVAAPASDTTQQYTILGQSPVAHYNKMAAPSADAQQKFTILGQSPADKSLQFPIVGQSPLGYYDLIKPENSRTLHASPPDRAVEREMPEYNRRTMPEARSKIPAQTYAYPNLFKRPQSYEDDDEESVVIENMKAYRQKPGEAESEQYVKAEALNPGNERYEAERVDAAEAKGPSVAQAKPQAIAMAGPGGIAAAAPVATAVVGPGGMAISAPSATAVAGPAGAPPIVAPAGMGAAMKAHNNAERKQQRLGMVSFNF